MNALAELTHLLPDTAKEIIDLIGIRPALLLIEQHGGQTLLIPQGKTSLGEISFDALAKTIGRDEAGILAKHFAGSRDIYIPKCATALRALRDNAIRREFDVLTRETSAKKAVANLCRAYGLSDRWVWEILKTPMQMSPEQADLF